MQTVASSGRPWWSWWLVVLVFVSACGPADDWPSPSVSIVPSDSAVLQLRPVVEIVTPSSAAWEETDLTCTFQAAARKECAASTLDEPRIVLPGPGEDPEKYVLGPHVVDGRDVERAVAQHDTQPGAGWIAYVDLTAEGTERFAAATALSVGSQIAIIVDGRIVSSPRVAVPITGGNVVVASGLTERRAAQLASRIDPE
jgi:preprotein translocase subunit SecD